MSIERLRRRVVRLEASSASLRDPKSTVNARRVRRLHRGTATQSDFEAFVRENRQSIRERLVLFAVGYALDRLRLGPQPRHRELLSAEVMSYPPDEHVPDHLRDALTLLRTQQLSHPAEHEVADEYQERPEYWIWDNLGATMLEADEVELRAEVAELVAQQANAGPTTTSTSN